MYFNQHGMSVYFTEAEFNAMGCLNKIVQFIKEGDSNISIIEWDDLRDELCEYCQVDKMYIDVYKDDDGVEEEECKKHGYMISFQAISDFIVDTLGRKIKIIAPNAQNDSDSESEDVEGGVEVDNPEWFVPLRSELLSRAWKKKMGIEISGEVGEEGSMITCRMAMFLHELFGNLLDIDIRKKLLKYAHYFFSQVTRDNERKLDEVEVQMKALGVEIPTVKMETLQWKALCVNKVEHFKTREQLTEERRKNEEQEQTIAKQGKKLAEKQAKNIQLTRGKNAALAAMKKDNPQDKIDELQTKLDKRNEVIVDQATEITRLKAQLAALRDSRKRCDTDDAMQMTEMTINDLKVKTDDLNGYNMDSSHSFPVDGSLRSDEKKSSPFSPSTNDR